MKLSVSLPDDDVAFLDDFAEQAGIELVTMLPAEPVVVMGSAPMLALAVVISAYGVLRLGIFPSVYIGLVQNANLSLN